MKTFTVTLLRHGKVNGPAALYGSTDVDVCADINQAIAHHIKQQAIPFETIISSPLRRCWSLASLINPAQPLISEPVISEPVISEPGFQEMHFGQLDGKPFDHIATNSDEWRQLERFWQDPANAHLPEAETLEDFRQRVIACWSQQIATFQGNVLIVTHGGVIRAILAEVLGLDWRNPAWYSGLSISNGSLTQIQVARHDNQIYFTVRQIGSMLN
ncbi:histidine phosphatase family protein [Photobacterium galatheae]|uniref:histidine phosphatase family protein n=1 Tax=Photobacterium galatheae TaxID=1654360 RepID=UPI00202CAB23|nr:histidine phosphatase family protein [Photobacterium galatheae]